MEEITKLKAHIFDLLVAMERLQQQKAQLLQRLQQLEEQQRGDNAQSGR